MACREKIFLSVIGRDRWFQRAALLRRAEEQNFYFTGKQ